jgi:hypothetical protein
LDWLKQFGPAQNILGPVKGQGVMPCPFTGHRMFCAGPNILCLTKNRTVFSATPKSFVVALKLNSLNANHLLVWEKKFGTGAICKSVFGMAQKIWTSPKCFGTHKRTRHYIVI